MTKEIILVAIFMMITIIIAVLISEPEITFKPFRLSVRAWYRGALYILVLSTYITVFIAWRTEYDKGFKDGISATIDYMIKPQINKGNGTEQHQ